MASRKLRLRPVLPTYLGRPWVLDPSASDATMQRLARDMGDRDHDVAMWIGEGRDVLSLRFNESDEFRVVLVSRRDADAGRAPSGYYLILVDLDDSHARRVYGPYATDLEARYAAAREIADDDAPEIFSGKSPRQMVVEGFRPHRKGPVEANRARAWPEHLRGIGMIPRRVTRIDTDHEYGDGSGILVHYRNRKGDRFTYSGPLSDPTIQRLLSMRTRNTTISGAAEEMIRGRGESSSDVNRAKGRSKLVEDAVEATRLYHGSGGASVRDQQRLYLRARRRIEAVAERYGRAMDPSLAVSAAWEEIAKEARARGPRTPMPGKDY